MARQRFKAWLTRAVHPAIERSVYVLVASALLALLFWAWRPIAPDWNLWFTDDPTVAPALLSIGFVGWGVVLVSTFLINHLGLFGLKQVWPGPAGHDLPVAVPALERDLESTFGDDYVRYRGKVGKLIPGVRGARLAPPSP